MFKITSTCGIVILRYLWWVLGQNIRRQNGIGQIGMDKMVWIEWYG